MGSHIFNSRPILIKILSPNKNNLTREGIKIQEDIKQKLKVLDMF